MTEVRLKTCTKCHETKPLDEFHNDNRTKDGKYSECKKCNNKRSKKFNRKHKKEKAISDKKYYQKHRKRKLKDHNIWYENVGRERAGSISMYENKSCPAYLGIVIAERLIRHLFKDIKIMPMHNPKFDFVCNKGKLIDVKSGCITFNGKYPSWQFNINHNTIADFFILVAFDNLTDLNPLHLWMIPGKELNNQSIASIRPSTIHKWDKYKRDIKDVRICCAELKKLHL